MVTMKSYWKEYLDKAEYLMLDSSRVNSIRSDYLKINRFTKRENSHIVWTGMKTKTGEPRFKSKFMMEWKGTINRPYNVRHFLFITTEEADVHGCKIIPLCGNNLCVKIEHMSVHNKRYFISQNAFSELYKLSKVYPLNYLSNFYDIKPRTLKKYLIKFAKENQE